MKKKIFFILNPKAGSGLNDRITNSIKKLFGEKEYETEIIFTSHPGHAIELSRKAVEDKFDIVAATGGDGTINETAQSLKNTNSSLAIIPTGSGNGFARHFKIPLNTEKAIAIIKKQKTIRVDSLLINEKFCLNLAGVGFDAYIASLFANYGKRGFISYIKLVMREYFSFSEKNYEIAFENKKIKRNAFLIAIANASQFGNGVRIAPLANADDGMIDVTILKKIPLPGIIFVLAQLFNGRLINSGHAEMLRSQSFTISSEDETMIHIDGEPFGSSKKIITTVEPLSVRLIIP